MTLSTYDLEHMDDIMAGHGDWFSAQLLRLCAKADQINLARLDKTFPEHVMAYLDWHNGKETHS